MFDKKFSVLFTLVLKLFLVNADIRSSLTFVIDDTGSMGDDIDAVKMAANAIFDVVMNSNNSQIEDFVLVTFNDPHVNHRITTKDRHQFKAALNSINVGGGGDCPEMSFSGIKEALERSRQASLLYVFTDASSQDPTKYDSVKQMAQDKEIKIDFILTGDCGYYDNSELYDRLAASTNGQVFHLNRKNEVKDILKYVETQINNRKITLARHTFPSGTHEFQYDVDDKMKEILISIAGGNPSVVVKGPTGEIEDTEDVVRISNVAIVKVKEVKPGVYTAEVSTSTNATIVVTAATTVHFQHGFSIDVPRNILDATTKPIPGEESYLSIKLFTDIVGSITLHSVQIVDMNNNVILEEPLEISDVEEQFYVSKRPVVSPNVTFRVAIKGVDPRTGTQITRISLTPLEPQSTVTAVRDIAPIVRVTGKNKLVTAAYETLRLRCDVRAHPRPTVFWVNSSGTVFESKVFSVKLPIDYAATLTIDQVKTNDTYKCIARNSAGEDSKAIEIEIVNYFNVIKNPRSTTIELDKEVNFECKVEANPPATITWYKNGNLLHENVRKKISDDGTVLSIKHSKAYDTGIYHCVVQNYLNSRGFRFLLKVTGAEPPNIEKSTKTVPVREGSDAYLRCRVIKGRPRPNIRWFFKHSSEWDETEISLSDYNDLEQILIRNVNAETSGTYRCEAQNEVGFDFHNIELAIVAAPKVEVKKDLLTINEGDTAELSCVAVGEPAPTVTWYHNATQLRLTKRYITYKEGVISFKAEISDTGNYICNAENEYGRDNKTIHLNVIIPVKIEAPKKSTFLVKVGEHLILPCRADGYPKPNIIWKYHSSDAKTPSKLLRPRDGSGKLILIRIQPLQQGFYTCLASNIGGSANITYEVQVQSPPEILVENPKRPFIGVEGDLVLRVPCNAIGAPRPEISWIRNGLGVPAGTEWYDIEKDGTLLIKNLDASSAGMYTCEAKNKLGVDTEIFEVVVDVYPKPHGTKNKLIIKQGESAALKCNTTKGAIETVRWYKNGRLLSTSDIHFIRNAQISDGGYYICRINSHVKSRSEEINVIVGFEPRFLIPEVETDIYFEDGIYSEEMDCTAIANPEPSVIWWHDEKMLTEKEMVYRLTMSLKDKGIYTCIVKNEHGSIKRQFNLFSLDCHLDIPSKLKNFQPLVTSYSESLSWPKFLNVDGFMNIPSGEYLKLTCPTGFSKFPTQRDITVSCDRETYFTFNGASYDFSDFNCKNEIEPRRKVTGINCLPGNRNAKTVKVGYDKLGNFVQVYEVCLDITNRKPYYAKHRMDHSIANGTPEFEDVAKDAHDTELYDCKQEKYERFTNIGKWFNREDDCCFNRRYLINPRDVFPGLPQKAVYKYSYTVPHWSTCNSENWDKIEEDVRKLTKAAIADITVWTGPNSPMLLDKPVSRFLWKVVQDTMTKAAVAIIQVNIPDFTSTQVDANVLCKDICRKISWIDSRDFHDIKKGYTYCCNVVEFEKAFGLENVFGATGKVLNEVPWLPEYYSV